MILLLKFKMNIKYNTTLFPLCIFPSTESAIPNYRQWSNENYFKVTRRNEVGYKTFTRVCVCFSPNGNAGSCKHRLKGGLQGAGWKYKAHKFTFTLNCISFLL